MDIVFNPKDILYTLLVPMFIPRNENWNIRIYPLPYRSWAIQELSCIQYLIQWYHVRHNIRLHHQMRHWLQLRRQWLLICFSWVHLREKVPSFRLLLLTYLAFDKTWTNHYLQYICLGMLDLGSSYQCKYKPWRSWNLVWLSTSSHPCASLLRVHLYGLPH